MASHIMTPLTATTTARPPTNSHGTKLKLEERMVDMTDSWLARWPDEDQGVGRADAHLVAGPELDAVRTRRGLTGGYRHQHAKRADAVGMDGQERTAIGHIGDG